jgi:prepilin-type N-terminal cleavage/methylation domain-containing protein
MSVVRRCQARGFTLIELLVVITIISILGAITFGVLPTVLMKTKVARMKAQFKTIDTALNTYYTEFNSYPPAYGYKRLTDNAWDDNNPDFTNFYLTSYFQTMGLYSKDSFVDIFSRTYETSYNKDGTLDLFDFSPIGIRTPTDDLILPVNRFLPGVAPAADVAEDIARQVGTDQRPVIYVPVNSDQYEKVRNFYYKGNVGTLRQRLYAEVWGDPTSRVGSMNYPPARYDKYVLISVGPYESTFGVACNPLGTEEPRDVYHITALRTYFLATRNANVNTDNFLDFDYSARLGQQSGNTFPDLDPTGTLQLYLLPDGSNQYGPMIYVGG